MIILTNHLSLIGLVGRWRATNFFVVFVLLFVFVFAFVFLFVFVRICICICIDRLGSQVSRYQREIQEDSDFIQRHSQDQSVHQPHHQPFPQFSHQSDQGVQQSGQVSDPDYEYQAANHSGSPPVFKQAAFLQTGNRDEMNEQAVAGFHLLDALEQGEGALEHGEDEGGDFVQQTVEEETVDMVEIPADRSQLAENRSFEDIFNEAGSFMADDEDVFMEEYERLDDQNAKEDSGSDSEVENGDISVVNHFKSIKFAQPIPKWH